MKTNEFLTYAMLSIILLIIAVPVFGANKVPMIYESGQIVMVEGEPRPLTIEQAQAFRNPGQKVPVNLIKEYCENLDFFHIAKIQEYDSVIIYQDGQMQKIQEISIVKGESELAFYKIWCLVAIAFMLVSNLSRILFLRLVGFGYFNFVFSFASTFSTIVAFINTATLVTTASFRTVAILAIIFGFFLTIFTDKKESFLEFYKAYIIISIIFYLLMILMFML